MKLKYVFFLTAILFLFPHSLASQEAPLAPTDAALFNKYVAHIAPFKSSSPATILEQTAQFFIGTPYVANTLDGHNEEQLVVNLHGLDCVTFVENVLALSMATRSNNLSMNYFKEKLQEIRYRNNEVTDYASRLHYTSDWMHENQNNGLLQNISQQLGGIKETKQINFMSSHPSAYKQLVNDEPMLHKIVEIERIINNRGGFYYLPKELIAAKKNDIPHMSVIAFITSIDGLDITHVGFAYRQHGKLTFTHASTAKMEVVIDMQSLSNYCLSQKNCKGILVAQVL